MTGIKKNNIQFGTEIVFYFQISTALSEYTMKPKIGSLHVHY